jgi:hypothetical protein
MAVETGLPHRMRVAASPHDSAVAANTAHRDSEHDSARCRQCPEEHDHGQGGNPVRNPGLGMDDAIDRWNDP